MGNVGDVCTFGFCTQMARVAIQLTPEFAPQFAPEFTPEFTVIKKL